MLMPQPYLLSTHHHHIVFDRRRLRGRQSVTDGGQYEQHPEEEADQPNLGSANDHRIVRGNVEEVCKALVAHTEERMRTDQLDARRPRLHTVRTGRRSNVATA